MSGDSGELRNYAKILAPFAGWCNAKYTSGAAVTQDLSLWGYPQTGADGGLAPDPGLLIDVMQGLQSTSNSNFTGLLGRYVRFSAFSTTAGATMWVLFGATVGAVSGANAPVIPTGAADILGPGVPEPIPCGTYVDLWISVNTHWLGLIGSSAGYLIARPSSVGGNG